MWGPSHMTNPWAHRVQVPPACGRRAASPMHTREGQGMQNAVRAAPVEDGHSGKGPAPGGFFLMSRSEARANPSLSRSYDDLKGKPRSEPFDCRLSLPRCDLGRRHFFRGPGSVPNSRGAPPPALRWRQASTHPYLRRTDHTLNHCQHSQSLAYLTGANGPLGGWQSIPPASRHPFVT